MTKRRQKELKRKYEPSDITSANDSEEIRKYFVDRMIQTIEFMSAKVFSGRVRDKDSENVVLEMFRDEEVLIRQSNRHTIQVVLK